MHYPLVQDHEVAVSFIPEVTLHYTVLCSPSVGVLQHGWMRDFTTTIVILAVRGARMVSLSSFS